MIFLQKNLGESEYYIQTGKEEFKFISALIIFLNYDKLS